MADDKVDKKPPVSVEKKEQHAPQIPAVPMVSLWALLNAVVFFGSLALAYALDQHHITLGNLLAAILVNIAA